MRSRKYKFRDQKLNYIHDNPGQAGFIDNPVHCPYIGVVDYANGSGYVKFTLDG
jgi:hypothetical protein